MKIYFYLSIVFLFASCGSKTNETTVSTSSSPLEWVKDKTIYEVNIRQYSSEGTLNKLTEDIERIKDMGADILWLMPVFPISEVKRKGSLGSYYSVADYEEINPEFGSLEDFEKMVDKAHKMGMYVILDWVPNHTGWDHKWITQHPEYYTKNEKGEIIDPIDPHTGEPWGWTDVADLNYDNFEMRSQMIASMQFWLKNYHIDGFRCDVAHGVPQDFWIACIDSLKKINPNILMLAEAEIPELRNKAGFSVTYAWTFKDIINNIASGKTNATMIDNYLSDDRKRFQKGYHMYFTTNHDENTWHGTVFERLGEGYKTFAVLTATFDGIPLIYNGQEAPLRKRLAFFEKDTIPWNNYENMPFFKVLTQLKKDNKALWNGSYGGEVLKIPTDKNENVYAFMREKEENKVVVILNLSQEEQKMTLGEGNYMGNYTHVFTNENITLEKQVSLTLKPWEYIVLSNNQK